ncbi:hypothetical protein [Roseomonas elaeocarpi]|uniref:Uncharacterized protein n=1 Tax=Roseomonas elaeocarpi TaxID=907779 RepID=A0ABV6JPB1_9PROT
MNRFALALVFTGFAVILANVVTLLGNLANSQDVALPVAIGSLSACLMLVGGLVMLERRTQSDRLPTLGVVA